uniref:Uncharacterized protein n=1 Tax=Oryza meridionalis TaxID=40149 RepID=A0A0E0E869_9ORYZ
MDVASLLPDNVLAAVFRRALSRRPAASARGGAASSSTAAASCARTSSHSRWAASSSTTNHSRFTQFLSHPTTGAAVSCRLDYTVPPPADPGVVDVMSPNLQYHCRTIRIE